MWGRRPIRGQVERVLVDHWPLDENAGTVAPNTVAGRTDGALFNGAGWTTDAERGQVLEFDGVDGYVDAGSPPPLTTDGESKDSFPSGRACGSLETAATSCTIRKSLAKPDGRGTRMASAARGRAILRAAATTSNPLHPPLRTPHEPDIANHSC